MRQSLLRDTTRLLFVASWQCPEIKHGSYRSRHSASNECAFDQPRRGMYRTTPCKRDSCTNFDTSNGIGILKTKIRTLDTSALKADYSCCNIASLRKYHPKQ